jgi:N-acetylglucosamine kinase-like BadF-type ATPase
MASDATDVLGLEGGGTRTTWARVARDGSVRAQGEAGPGNTLLQDDAALGELFRRIAGAAGTDVAAVGGAFAGCAHLVARPGRRPGWCV